MEADLSNKYDKTGGTITGDALITGGLTVQTSLLLGSFLAAQNGYTFTKRANSSMGKSK
jgi:hypothetical protein